MEPARAPEESAARDSSEHQRSREHERLLELARRLRAVVEELRHYAGESAQHAEAAAQAPLARSDALMLDGHAGEALYGDGRVTTHTSRREQQLGGTPTLAGSRASRILVNAGFRAVADIGSKLATAALYVFVARKLGASEFGIFTFALSFVTIVTALGFFGQDIVLAREVARDRSRLEEYYSNAMLARSMFSVPPLLVVLLIAWAGGMSQHTLLVVLLLGFGFTGDYMVQVPFAVFQTHERAEFVAVVLIAQRWITTGIAIAALYLGVGLVGVVGIYCAGSLFAVALGTAMMYSFIDRPRLHVDFRGALRVTREAFPIGIAFVALALLFRIDMTMLAMFKPASEVGQYGAAYKLLETTAFFSWAVNVAVLPSLSRLSPTTSPTVGFVYQRALKLLIAITLPVAVGAIVLAEPIISLLYGPEYHRAAEALALLAPTIALFSLSSLSSQLFFVQGRRQTVAIVFALVALENIALNLVLIPQFSLLGAAAGTSISELLVASSLIFLAGALRGRLQVARLAAGPVLASAAAGLVMFLLRYKLAVALPLGIATYFTVLISFEQAAFPDDFSVARALLDQIRSRLAGAPAQGEAA
jgi:O-antigen/teichoic acid export membrane protein